MDTQLITDNFTTIIENNGSTTEGTLVLQKVNPNGSKTILNYPKSENIDIDNEVMLPSKINELIAVETSSKPIETSLFVPKPFIEANTSEISLHTLKSDCVIPVFSKDNERTIAHTEFIEIAQNCISKVFPHHQVDVPEVRVSHQIKGRVPSAINKQAKDLLDHERTQYFERMAFIIRIPSIVDTINGNEIALCIGGVRSYNLENFTIKRLLKNSSFLLASKLKYVVT